MAIVLLIAFIAVPLAEIAVFIEVGGRIGAVNTILMVVLTAMAGASLLRRQGIQTLNRVQESFSRNVFPVTEVFDGLCLLAAGALLLTPGFVTDTLGLVLFIPSFRRRLRRWIWLWLTRSGTTHVWVNGEEAGRAAPTGTIEGDFREIDTERDPKDGGKPPLGRR